MKHQIQKGSVRSLCVVGIILSCSLLLNAKAWQNGFIAELRPDGFVLQTRFYPHIIVHTTATTLVRCNKHSLPLSDLQLHDLVTVEGSYKHDGSTDATRITLHRRWWDCKSAKTPKPAHCEC
jgi:hypothetical protein